MTIKEILTTIDTSKMEREYVDFYEMVEKEFGIYEFIPYPEKNIRLTYCYYHSWICTDTQVGLRVWYLDNRPVCISWKPYRKYDESFTWLSYDDFNEVKKYIKSLIQEDEYPIDIIDDDILNKVLDNLNKIENKQFEKFNIKTK